MRIGILTFHYAHNYGAVFQAFSLKKYLESNGNSVVIINYQNENISRSYRKKRHMPHKNAYYLHHWLRFICDYFLLKTQKKDWNERRVKFTEFIYSYLTNSNLVSVEDIPMMNLDVIISGSDQVWNTAFTKGIDNAYFLNFLCSSKKVFYAPSNGGGAFKNKDAPIVVDIMKKVDYISSREYKTSLFLEEKLGKRIPTVVDPVFLLDKNTFVNCFSLKQDSTSKFVLAYFIYEDNRMRMAARMISKALGLPLIELHCYKIKPIDGEKIISTLSPTEFLQAIYDSSFIITNSFHGTALSIIFQKQFYSFYMEDDRKSNLLNSLCINDRHAKEIGDIDLNTRIDYASIDLNSYSIKSKEFLKKALY